jgi:hypothetical protein
VAYVKISRLKADCAADIQAAAATTGLIIDIRDYPSDFPIFTLGGMLVTQPTPFVRFTFGDASNPGVFRLGDPLSLTPLTQHAVTRPFHAQLADVARGDSADCQRLGRERPVL